MRRFRISTVIVLMLLASAVTFTVTYFMLINSLNERMSVTNEREREYAAFMEAREKILQYYIGDADTDHMMEEAIRGMVGSLGDMWSAYLTPEEYEALTGLLTGVSEQYVGIGIAVSHDADTNSLRVTDVYDGSPAEEAGIHSGDRIVGIDGNPIGEIGYDIAIAMLHGEENTPVALTLIDGEDNRERTARVVRRLVSNDAVSSEILQDNIGYIRIRNFDGGVSLSFRAAVANLQNAGVEGLLLDLRDNPGGSLNEMLPMLDILLPEGPLFLMRNKAGEETSFASDAECWEIPMFALVNGGSYSAAEFFAAALQEYQWATIVGAPTTGKGYSQASIKLSNGSALWLSTNEYFTPLGKSLAGVGIRPEIPVMAESEESQLLKPRGQDLTFQTAEERMKHRVEEERVKADNEAVG